MTWIKGFLRICLVVMLGITMSFGFTPPQATILTKLQPASEVVVTWNSAPDGFFEDFDGELAPGFEWVASSAAPAFEDSYAKIIAQDSWVSGVNVDESFRDCSAEATLVNVSGTSSRGLVVRASGPLDGTADLYAFWLSYSAGGAYSLWRYSPDGACAILPWTHSDRINEEAGETNTLSVFAAGGDLDLYINGNYMATVHDLGLASGFTGVGVAPGSEVWVDDVCCYHESVPPSADAIPCEGARVNEPLDDQGRIHGMA